MQQVAGARISPVPVSKEFPVSKNSDFLSVTVTSCHSVSDQLLRLTNFEELPMTAVR